MSTPRVRPIFRQRLSVEPRVFLDRLEEAIRDLEGRCRGLMLSDGAILKIRREERRIWSPALHLQLELEGDGPGEVVGRFSPSSPVWTAFIAIYIGLACLALGAVSYGYAQVLVEETAWAFFGVPLAALLAGLTYGAAFIGQGLGAEDMHELRSFVERLIEDGKRSGLQSTSNS
ncbi:MAG: hypothetical protein ACYTG5_02375 [Planctomycetota bacterium]